MKTFKPGWYVLYTKPRHEKKVLTQLQHIEVGNFLPLAKTLRVWSDRKKYLLLPLFPSYIFVKLENLQSYFRSLELNGILYFVKTGKEIAQVNEAVIDRLKLVDTNCRDNVEVSPEYFLPGKNLFIEEGPFAGFCCEVVEHKGKQKILVRIELLQRSILLDISTRALMPLQNNYSFNA
jgi:transcription antitermination factor NusG